MWPRYFPSDCPPSEASPQERPAYRLVLHDPPSETDFECPKVMQQDRRFGDECLACGVSLIGEMRDARRLLGTIYFRQKRYRLAQGRTKTGCGLVLDTPSESIPSHITYWIYPGNQVHNDFQVVS